MVPCPTCGQDVDWITVGAAAKLLDISEVRVKQLIAAGSFPGSAKTTAGVTAAFWKLPIRSVIAYKKAREER